MSNPLQQTLIQTPTLNKWLLSQYRRKVVLIPSFVALTMTVIPIVGHILNFLGSPWFRHSLFLFQAVLCSVFLFLIPLPRISIKKSERASAATEQFLEAYKRLWLFWIMLYLVFFSREMGSFLLKQQFETHVTLQMMWRNIFGWLIDVMNNLQTLSLIMLYLVITKSTVDLNRKESKLPWSTGLGVFAIITVVELFAAVGSAIPKSNNIPYQEVFEVIRQILMWGSGFLAGVALALVVGRFDSKYVDSPTWCIIFLYCYALIQVPLGAFEQNKTIETVIISAALLLKSLLFLFVAWLFETGILFFFVNRVANLINDARRERDEYLKQLTVSEELG